MTKYRVYLENAYWDIIVIDEAHNVAERGQRIFSTLKALKTSGKKSDTLIMLSATPTMEEHAALPSIMNMLDPTAIAILKITAQKT